MTRNQAVSIGTVAVVLLMLMVEGRVPSPNPDVPHVARADSEAVPARSPAATTEAVSVDGGGEDGSGWTATWIAGSPTPASTVTSQALQAAPSATAYAAIDPVPAIPPAASRLPATSDLEASVRASVERWFPASEWEWAMRVAYCESRYQPWAVEASGDHIGIFQVAASIWGPVPSDIGGQVAQAAEVLRQGGRGMWSCR